MTIGALVPTASLLCLVFVSDEFAQRALHLSPDQLRLVNATVALFAFVCVLVQLVWKPDSREAAHARAVHYYIERERDAAPPCREPAVAGPQHLPPIREAAFIRLKRFHVRKLSASRLLDEDPWRELPEVGHPTWPIGRSAPNRPASAPPALKGLELLCACGSRAKNRPVT